ncbi:hypothetical protein AN216_06765 [Streptomyces oceani]|uniref:Uncharacterized protein n=1 Tax=Streptomyces oceani TaxID=1075402 RepID=A0A1E7KL52_9ACTN|nr:hypothetical protein AN216_06765 [Streptomyces oceani]
MSGEWTRLSRRVSSCQPERPGALKKLDGIAADHLDVLHRTMREDPSAFGLYEATRAAGDRLAAHLSIDAPHVGTARFAARFTQTVGGEGGTIADAAVRRAAAATTRRPCSRIATASGHVALRDA